MELEQELIEDFNAAYKENHYNGESFERELERKRQRFVSKFTSDFISHGMEKEEYCIGQGRHDTFCYIIERELRGLGSILGSNASKFGLYWGQDEKTFLPTKKFGDNAEEAFATICEELTKIIKAAKDNDLSSISDSLFAYTVRHKIYYLYNPLYDIPVFSEEHLDSILDYFDIDVHPSVDKESEKRIALYEFKDNHPLFSQMSNRKFMSFLYHYDLAKVLEKDSVAKRNRAGETIDFIETSLLEDFPKERRQLPRKGKSNYDDIASRKSFIGKTGEEIVLAYEKRRHPTFSRRIKRVSLESDALGYDVLSFDDNGKEVHIEVKTKTNGRRDNVDFYITANELEKLRDDQEYLIYYVCGITTKHKTIYAIRPSQVNDITLNPVLFRVKATVVR